MHLNSGSVMRIIDMNLNDLLAYLIGFIGMSGISILSLMGIVYLIYVLGKEDKKKDA